MAIAAGLVAARTGRDGGGLTVPDWPIVSRPASGAPSMVARSAVAVGAFLALALAMAWGGQPGTQLRRGVATADDHDRFLWFHFWFH